MKINPDDPKWTAYVLGELGEAERAELEHILESSAAAREAVDEIGMATMLLKEEFAKEPAVGLTPVQKQAIRAAVPVSAEAAAEAGGRRRTAGFADWFRSPSLVTAAAAVFLMIALSAPLLLRSRKTADSLTVESARNDDMSYNQTVQAPSVPAASTDGNAPAGQAPAIASSSIASSSIASPSIKVGQEAPGRDAPNPETRRQANEQLRTETQSAQAAMTAIVPVFPAPGAADNLAVNGPPQPTGQAPTVPLPGRLGQGFAVRSTVAKLVPGVAADAGRPRYNTEAYDFISDASFIRAAQEPLATFSIDVDTASYANLRRFITASQLPPKDAVRIEEMINYFTYDYAPPTGAHPIAAYAEVAAAPWRPEHRLVRVAIKGKEVDISKRPASNLVFLIDVSGSMRDAAKLPLLKTSMKLIIDQLTENDRVAIVVYAGASGLVLPATSGDKKAALLAAVDSLESGGSTNGAAGIQLAYDTAVANFVKGGINRVILATDGDFNVGVTNQGDLTRLIEDKARSGVFLTVLGFGMGNLKDSTLEKLADRGNGNYAYIDTLSEARKVLVEELSGTLMTIAKDVKVQVEFNPGAVNAYRLIGYENRALRPEDFNNDQKDAGDMGAGHTVTALFEVVPRGVDMALPGVDPLRYRAESQARTDAAAVRSGEMLHIKIRYKEPDGDVSRLLDLPLVDRNAAFNNATTDFRFAASVAAFGMILRDSPHKGQANLDAVIDMAERGKGTDRGGYRSEFIQLVRKTRTLKERE